MPRLSCGRGLVDREEKMERFEMSGDLGWPEGVEGLVKMGEDQGGPTLDCNQAFDVWRVARDWWPC